jgi:hypothetical protein
VRDLDAAAASSRDDDGDVLLLCPINLLRISGGSSASTLGSGFVGMMNCVPATLRGVWALASFSFALAIVRAGCVLLGLGLRGVNGLSVIGSCDLPRPVEGLDMSGPAWSWIGSASAFFAEAGPRKGPKLNLFWLPSGFEIDALRGSSLVSCTPRPRRSPGLNLYERSIETASLPRTL